MKPGWKTTEFWQTTIAQSLALLTLLGFVSAGDNKSIEEALGKSVTAIFTLIVNALVVVHYVQGRFRLKANGSTDPDQGPPNSGFLKIALVGGIALFALSGPAQAQSLFPWRNNIQQQVQRHEQQISQLINQPRQPAPAPNAGPQPIIIVQPHAPQPTFPIQGQPQQNFPIQGQPQQSYPIPGAPLQPLPIQGLPQQQMPIQGSPQPLPITPNVIEGPQSYSIKRALAKPLQ